MKIYRWPLAITVFFAFIVLLNIQLLILAASGYGGLLDEHPYEKGLSYDRERAEQEKFEQSGWTMQLRVNPLQLSAFDADRSPISGASVHLHALRPNNAALDIDMSLKETSPGSYAGSVSLIEGRWIVGLMIDYGGETYRIKRTVFSDFKSNLILIGEER